MLLPQRGCVKLKPISGKRDDQKATTVVVRPAYLDIPKATPPAIPRFSELEKKMKDFRASLYFLALALLVCLFIPGSASAQTEDAPPCCRLNSIHLFPLSDGVGILTNIYLIDTSDNSASTDPYSNPAAATSADSTTAPSTTTGNSVKLTAAEASRNYGSRLKSGETGRTKRSGHGTD